jgi:hypothetical protein
MRLPSVPINITSRPHPWRRQPFFVEMYVVQGSLGSSGLLRTGCERIRNRLESSAPGAAWFRTVEGTAVTRAENSGRSRIPLHRVRRCPGGPRYLCTTCGCVPMVRDGSALGAQTFLTWKMPLHRVRTLLKRSERGLKRLQRHSDEAFTFDLSSST